LKVYLSVPMISNRSLDRARLMAEAVAEAGHVVSSPWVLGPIEHQADGVSLNIFDRDTRGAEDCDCLLADVSLPSTGVGMEIMAAHKAGRRVLLVAKRGSVISRMLMHMKKKELVEFESDAALRLAILGALRSGSSG
jgi:2'-deoxynucleoside 5'-phosphate N-hydrolase